MKINYYKDTDSLYISLSSKPGAESMEVSECIVLDYDIDNASNKVDLGEVILGKIPSDIETVTA